MKLLCLIQNYGITYNFINNYVSMSNRNFVEEEGLLKLQNFVLLNLKSNLSLNDSSLNNLYSSNSSI